MFNVDKLKSIFQLQLCYLVFMSETFRFYFQGKPHFAEVVVLAREYHTEYNVIRIDDELTATYHPPFMLWIYPNEPWKAGFSNDEGDAGRASFLKHIHVGLVEQFKHRD